MDLVNELDESAKRQLAFAPQHIPHCLEYLAAREIERLRQITRNVYEVWAGSEGITVPETVVEAYLLRLIEQMRDEAKLGDE